MTPSCTPRVALTVVTEVMPRLAMQEMDTLGVLMTKRKRVLCTFHSHAIFVSLKYVVGLENAGFIFGRQIYFFLFGEKPTCIAENVSSRNLFDESRHGAGVLMVMIQSAAPKCKACTTRPARSSQRKRRVSKCVTICSYSTHGCVSCVIVPVMCSSSRITRPATMTLAFMMIPPPMTTLTTFFFAGATPDESHNRREKRNEANVGACARNAGRSRECLGRNVRHSVRANSAFTIM